MKKVLFLIWFLFSFILVNSLYSQSQSNMFYRGEMNGWGSTAMSSLNLPTVNYNWVVTIDSDGDDSQSDFKFANTVNWSGIDWSRGDQITLNSLTNFYQPNGGNGHFSESASKSYTFTFKDVSSGNSEGYVFEFSSAPVNISSVTESNTISAWPGQSITITASLTGVKPTEQKIWLRYSISSDFSSSTILSMSNVSGNDYSADIPSSANISGVTIYYYAFSTGDITATHINADIATINFTKPTNNSYTVATTWTTTASGDGSWNDPNSWDAGVVPVSGQPVTIEDDLVLDQTANVSNLIISNGVTFTASDATPRTLTISDGGTLTNNGTFTASTGKVSFAGSGTVAGSSATTFNDVDISGGVNFGSASTIDGTLTINAGGFVNTNAPTYSSNSTLLFDTGGAYTIDGDAAIWETGTSLGKGIPNNVTVGTTNPLNIYQARDVTGNLTINSGGTVVQGNNVFTIQGNFTNAGTFSFVADGASPLIVKGNLINQSDASITLSNQVGGDMHLEGDYQSSGTVNFNNRAIFFKGGNPQLVTGANDPINFDYLFVDKTGATTLTFDQNVSINDKFDQISGNATIASGKTLTIGASAVADIASGSTLTTNGNLVLSSDGTGTGSLIVNGTISGDVTVERYLTNYDNATDAKYHFISSPISNQKIQDVMDGEVVSVENFVTDPPTAGVDFYKFDEPTNTWINSKALDSENVIWNENFEDNFEVGRGYLVAYPTAPVTKAFSGTINNDASYVLSCTYTDGEGNGWNLLGNPYPAAINWNAVTLGDGVDNALYYYDASTQNYIAYLRISGDNYTSTGGSQYIPAGQGFMVHANNTGSTKTVTIEKADLTHTGQDVYYKSSTNLLSGSLSLQVTGNNFSDKTIIHFNEQATTDFDGKYDAFKLMSANMQVPMIYTSNEENVQFAINGLPQIEEGTSIPVSLRIGADGTYTIDANINEIETNIFLEDLFTGTSTKLNENPTYSFTASEGDDPNRFLLHFGVVGIGEQEQAPTLQAYMVDNRLYVNNSLEQAQLAIYDLQGRLVAEQSLNSGGLQALPLDLPAGVYIVRLNNASESRAVKINVQ
jgi:hypothetical protein